MSIVEQLIFIYGNVLPKVPNMLSHEEALKYFERLLMNGNIITYIKDNELCGFLEFWRITPETFGKVCLGLPISHDTDLLNGNICLISRMYITPDLRNTETFINLGRTFLEKNKDATHFAAIQTHKRHKPLQIYSRDEILKHYKIGS